MKFSLKKTFAAAALALPVIMLPAPSADGQVRGPSSQADVQKAAQLFQTVSQITARQGLTSPDMNRIGAETLTEIFNSYANCTAHRPALVPLTTARVETALGRLDSCLSPNTPDVERITNIIINQMLYKVDPHSRYHPPEQYRQLLNRMSGGGSGPAANPVSGALLEGDIGYIQLRSFGAQDTQSKLRAEIAALQRRAGGAQNIRGYVLDLRGNTGGLMNQAIGIADDFLERGRITSVGSGNPARDRHHNARRGDIIGGKPLIVLTNGNSASASEVLAAALQDHRRARILGTLTYGKGSVQSIIPLSWHSGGVHQGALRLTTALYFSPNGRAIQGQGVTPDIGFNPQPGSQTLPPQTGRREAALPGTISNPGTAANSVTTTAICSPRRGAAPQDRSVPRLGNGGTDHQLLCALDSLKNRALHTQLQTPRPSGLRG